MECSTEVARWTKGSLDRAADQWAEARNRHRVELTK